MPVIRPDRGAAEVLFLDEPTVGQEIVGKDEMRRFNHRMRDERGLTVMLTTHNMRDIEEICNRIVMIDKEWIVFDLRAAEVRTRFGSLRTLVVQFERELSALELAGVAGVREGNVHWDLSFDRSKIGVNELIRRLSALCPCDTSRSPTRRPRCRRRGLRAGQSAVMPANGRQEHDTANQYPKGSNDSRWKSAEFDENRRKPERNGP